MKFLQLTLIATDGGLEREEVRKVLAKMSINVMESTEKPYKGFLIPESAMPHFKTAWQKFLTKTLPYKEGDRVQLIDFGAWVSWQNIHAVSDDFAFTSLGVDFDVKPKDIEGHYAHIAKITVQTVGSENLYYYVLQYPHSIRIVVPSYMVQS